MNPQEDKDLAREIARYRSQRAEESSVVHPGIEPALDTSAPLAVARAFVRSRVSDVEIPEPAYWQGEFWTHRATHYELFAMDALKAAMYRWLDHHKNVKGQAIKPTRRMVDGVIDALKAESLIDVQEAPAWLVRSDQQGAASDFIACSNGLLYLPERRLIPTSREFFNLNALGFDYAPAAPEPIEWLSFLRDLWADDLESIETLQEIFGLALTGDTQHQKAFLIVGPRRSGKGTIARILTALVGMSNVTAPMLSSIGQQFGLESMIGKTLALISDARIGGRADLAAIVENLLRITGEDAVSVPRKFKSDWTARLKVRFVILSNELPALLDQSGALSGRFIVLRLTKSFYGVEDLGLTSRLLGEMPGIMLWALTGLDRLRKRGHFRQPQSAAQMVRELETISSPIKSFVAECCIVAPGGSVAMERLFEAWKEWASKQGRDHPGTIQTLGRNISAAFPELQTSRPRIPGEKRARHYEGIRLREMSDPDPE